MSARKVCAGCKVEKAQEEFGKMKTGGFYDNCNACFILSNQQFWQGKNFKACRGCKEMLPIEDYKRDAHGCPQPKCKTCFSEWVKLQYRQKQAAAVKAQASVNK
jgi:hypothetical protein